MKKTLLVLLISSLLGFAGGTIAFSSSQKDTMKAKVTAANTALLKKFTANVFNRRDLSKLTQFMREDYIQHNPFVGQGSKGFNKFFSVWFKASPDFKYTPKQVIAKGDKVWTYGTYSGTYTGEFLGQQIKGKKYAFDAIDIFRIQDGKLAEHWDVADNYTLFKNLGVLK